MIPSDSDILDRFARINIWKRGGERAPPSPILHLGGSLRHARAAGFGQH